MRATAAVPSLMAIAVIAVATLGGAPGALAEEGVESLPVVAVPDLRGMTMAEAFEAVRKVGLTPGPVERTSLDVLARELRRHYAPGIVVEQLPTPFDGSMVRHVPVGSGVAMRVSSLASGTTLRPLVPGVDVGVRSSSGFGASLFYRYAASHVDWHHIGAKAEFETKPFLAGRVYLWTGLGVEYATTSGTTAGGDGFGGFAELGLGVVLSRSIRARLGANLHAVYTDAARRSPTDDWNRRWLWTLAPVLAVEVDF